uniref:Uncharacterized protein n=1 Tax=viral metagenome TaxID=1070528 RepID=A0A6C0IYV5_9ZZZZ
MWLELISPFYYTKQLCEDNLHDLMVLNCLNIVLTSITICVILLKSPIRVVDNRVDLK